MRCKRCGEPLEPMDTHCPVCGRAAAPRKKAPSQKKNESSIKLPQLEKFTHAYNRDTALSRAIQLLTVTAVAVAVVLLVLVYTGMGALQSAVGQLQRTTDAQLQALQNQSQTPAASETEPPVRETEPPIQQSEPPIAATQPLSRQTLEATLSLDKSRGDTYATAWMTLESDNDRAVSWVHTGSGQTGAIWILENAGDRLEVKLRERTGETQTELGLEWTLSGSTFSAMADAVCIWECRAGGGEWESLPNDCVTVSPADGTCDLMLSTDQLTTLRGQHSSLELRCHLSMQHPEGGSLKLLAAGITLSD